MDQIVTVVSKAASRDLITLAQVKDELQISGTDSDSQIETLRERASQALVGYCNREFARDTIQVQIRDIAADMIVMPYGFPDPANVAEFCSISSVSLDGEDLTTDEYEFDPASGLLYRLFNDRRRIWHARKLVIQYTAGYILPDDPSATLPAEVQGAALELIKAARFNATRDPALRSETILSGLYAYTLFDPTNAQEAWPTTVTNAMDKYCNPLNG